MRRQRLLFLPLAMASLASLLQAKCTADPQGHPSNNSEVLINSVVITGTQDLTSAELARISAKLTGQCVAGDPDEVEQLVRTAFQDRGFISATVKDLRIKPEDPLAVPRPVTVEAEVAEGSRYRLAEIHFVGNLAFSEAKLRSEFPMRKGDLFERANVAAGIDHLRKSYASNGFADFWASVETQSLSDATMNLVLSIHEGSQYRMGSFEVFAKKEVAEKLQEAWQLPEGSVFDFSYVDKYVATNRGLLPMEFARDNIQIVRDCPAALISVRLPLDGTDPKAQAIPKNVPCEAPDAHPKP